MVWITDPSPNDKLHGCYPGHSWHPIVARNVSTLVTLEFLVTYQFATLDRLALEHISKFGYEPVE